MGVRSQSGPYSGYWNYYLSYGSCGHVVFLSYFKNSSLTEQKNLWIFLDLSTFIFVRWKILDVGKKNK